MFSDPITSRVDRQRSSSGRRASVELAFDGGHAGPVGRAGSWLARRHAPVVEATLVVLLYLLYDASRGLAAGGRTVALSHGRDVASVERTLHIFIERDVQRAVVAVPHLIGVFNTGYEVLHLSVPALVLIGLWRHRPDRFALVRNALLVTSGLALVGFIVFPTAPPRLAGLGIGDTMSHGPVNTNSGLLEHFYNPYAAFPSLHIGYAVVSGVAIWAFARRWPFRVLGLVYPGFVAVAVMATGNHFLIDILAGAAVAGAGLVAASGLQRLAVSPKPITVLPSPLVLPVPSESLSGLSTPGRQAHVGESVSIWRDGRRVIQISATLLRHATAALAEMVWERLARRNRLSPASARRLRRALEDLGPTFVKVGQLLSSRADLLAEPYQRELARLRDHAPAVPLAKLKGELEGYYGRPLDVVFASFSSEPLAAASVSQVHEAVLWDGRRVAVKVRRPGISSLVDTDLSILERTAAAAGRYIKVLRRYDVARVVAEVATMIHQELDFTREATSAITIRRLFEDDPGVVVPRIVEHLSGPAAIVMDLLDGVSISQPAALDAAGVDRRRLAGAVISANLTMIFSSGPFHADPHPGNFLALPGGRIGLLDFGATGTADPETRATLAGLLTAVVAGDAHKLADGIVALTTPTGPVDRDRLTVEVRELLVPIAASSLQTLPLGRVLRQLLGLLRRYRLHVSPHLVPLVRAVIECESTAQELHPDAALTDVLIPFLAGQRASEQPRSSAAAAAA